MDRQFFAAWVTMLGKAWETKDADAAAELFAEDATYQEDSFAEPMRGREAIRGYWADVPLTQDHIAFGSEVIAVSDDRGIAHWWCLLTRIPSGVPVKLDGIFVVTFDSHGHGQTFREWWQKQEVGSDS